MLVLRAGASALPVEDKPEGAHGNVTVPLFDATMMATTGFLEMCSAEGFGGRFNASNHVGQGANHQAPTPPLNPTKLALCMPFHHAHAAAPDTGLFPSQATPIFPDLDGDGVLDVFYHNNFRAVSPAGGSFRGHTAWAGPSYPGPWTTQSQHNESPRAQPSRGLAIAPLRTSRRAPLRPGQATHRYGRAVFMDVTPHRRRLTRTGIWASAARARAARRASRESPPAASSRRPKTPR